MRIIYFEEGKGRFSWKLEFLFEFERKCLSVTNLKISKSEKYIHWLTHAHFFESRLYIYFGSKKTHVFLVEDWVRIPFLSIKIERANFLERTLVCI